MTVESLIHEENVGHVSHPPDLYQVRWSNGIAVGHNEALERSPGLLNQYPFGAGWLLIVRPASDNWREGLVTGDAIAPAFEAWFATDAYKDRR